VAVLAFEPLGIAPERAAAAERAVRAGLGAVPGVELADPAEVRALLSAEPDLRDCAETRCLASIAERLGAQSVVSGVVGGLGAFRSLVVKRTDREGKVVTSVSEALPEDDAKVPDLVCAVLGRPAGCARQEAGVAAPGLALPPPPQVVSGEPVRPMRATRKAALGVGAGAIASFGAALGLGLSSRSIAGQVERVDPSCDAACLQDRFTTGRMHADLSNVFWGVGGALAAAAVVLFVLPEPAPSGTVALGPGPTPLGLSAHARF